LGRSARSIASSPGEAGAALTTRRSGSNSSVWIVMVGRLSARRDVEGRQRTIAASFRTHLPMSMSQRLLAAVALALAAAAAGAAGERALEIRNPQARATAPSQPTGGGYFAIVNTGREADRLVGASAPTVADRVELHRMQMEGDVMRMREVGTIDVPAGQTVELRPGGLHLMLMGLKKPLVAGQAFPVTLRFEKAGAVEVQMQVVAPGAEGAAAHKH
jgi:copper(I)-binding protein